MAALMVGSSGMTISSGLQHGAGRSTGSVVELRQHALSLRDRGFTVIPDAGLSSSLVARARADCIDEVGRLRGMIEGLGLDAVDDRYAFSEIDKRHRLRWSIQATRNSAWTACVDEALPRASEVIERLHTLPAHPDDEGLPLFGELLPKTPRLDHVGAIVSGHGAKAQAFHADAGELHLRLSRLSTRHRLFNMFVPLVDLEAGGMGTMFWPRSHHMRSRRAAYQAAVARAGSLEADPIAMSEMESPACPSGGIIQFDFRVLHRGLPNQSEAERPIAHAILSTGLAVDQKRTPPTSLVETVASLPTDPNEREEARKAIIKEQRQTWQWLRASSAQ